ncbi:MAG: hypothetical protein JWR52_3261 [Marmoricola sp.]|nr:hypothetical protein [Marmoricola sp.]
MLVTSFVPFALVGYLVAAIGLAVLRPGTDPALKRWTTGGIVLALAGVVFHGALLVPAYFGAHPTGKPELTVMALNLRHGNGEATRAVALVRSQHVQLATLEEVTPAELARLSAAGLNQLLPYSAGAPGPNDAGTMIFSTYPLTATQVVPLGHGAYRVRVLAPTPFWLVAVHATQPLVSPGGWRADWGVLNTVVPQLPGSVILMGDFNTTLDHGPMRDLLGKGFHDAARTANSGWQPTWPSGGSIAGIPDLGLIAIDHVITRGAYDAISTETFTVPNTDHRALVARLARTAP